MMVVPNLIDSTTVCRNESSQQQGLVPSVCLKQSNAEESGELSSSYVNLKGTAAWLHIDHVLG